jgi:beta-lactamase superfamily II metal-dependent hydrolase
MKRFYWILVLLFAAGNILVYRDIFTPTALTVSVLSVGKGDATFVQTPSGKTLLIDTGPDASILRALGSALPFWQRSIDAVLITNQSAGSAGGLTEVQSLYHILNLIHFTATEERISLGDDADAVVLASPKGFINMNVHYGATMLTISTSTPPGVYALDGKTVTTK